METHAALPDLEDLQRVGQVVLGLVEQAVAQAPTDDDAHHAEEQDVFDVLAAPGAGTLHAGKGLVAQAAHAQQQEQAEGGQVGQPVPVHGERPDLHGDGINMGVHEHGVYGSSCLWRFAGRIQKETPPQRGTG